MMLNEATGKQLLAGVGLAVPSGALASCPEEAEKVAATIGRPVVVKAQVPAGGRGKAGGVLLASSSKECADAARRLLGTVLSGHRVDRVLVEEQIAIEVERYAAVVDDATTAGPLVLLSPRGGMDIEEINEIAPREIVRHPVDIRVGLSTGQALAVAEAAGLDEAEAVLVADALVSMHRLYVEADAQLVEVNPLARDAAGRLWALDAKIVLDEAALDRHEALGALAPPGIRDSGTDLERRGAELGMLFMELDGSVGILANGAGLTMATLDAVAHFGGRAANFLEIGGQNYSRAEEALRLVLAHPRVRCVLVNFCGAFARTDVMAEGVVRAVKALRPEVPFFFSIHGTGEAEAVALVREHLGIEPYPRMEDAVQAAVQAAEPDGEVGGR